MRHSLKHLVAASAVVTLMAGPAAAQKAEVLHWWTSGGESASIQVFAEMYEAQGGEWIDTAIAIGENARAAGTNRIVGGDPPTAMQFNTGKQFDDLVAQGLLFDLEAVATAGKWRDFLPETLVNATNRDGKFYAVPDQRARRELALLQQGALQGARRARSRHLGALLRSRRQDQGGRQGGARARRAAVAGAAHVQQRAHLDRRRRDHGEGLWRAGHRHHPVRRVPPGGRHLRQAARLRGRGEPRPQLERCDEHGADRPGRHAVHGRLGEGRVRGGRQGGRRRLRMHPGRPGRDLFPDRRRRLRLPDPARRGRADGAAEEARRADDLAGRRRSPSTTRRARCRCAPTSIRPRWMPAPRRASRC